MIKSLKKRLKVFLQSFFFFYAKDIDITAESGPTLVIAPHPDDEVLGCGAAIARLRAAGQKVRIVVVTDGSASGRSSVIMPHELANRRRKEALDSGHALGVASEDIVFLEFPDGRAEKRRQAIEAALAGQIRALDPRRIFSPYGTDGHSDHRVIAAIIDRLNRAGAISCPVYEYPVWFWSYGAFGHLFQPHKLGRLRRIHTQEFLANKKAAIAVHRSQLEAPTSESGWFIFPSGFLAHFLAPFELFFEKPRKDG